MANYCENNLSISGDGKELKEFNKKTQTKKLVFTLEKLVPTPKEYLKKGDERWYDWRKKEWGTKWDVYPDSVSKDFDDDRIDISFDTAWSPPLEWLKKASKIFKNLFFRIHYKEEGMGYEGVAKVNNGKLEDKYIEY